MRQVVNSLVGLKDDGCGVELVRKLVWLIWLVAGGLLLVGPLQDECRAKGWRRGNKR